MRYYPVDIGSFFLPLPASPGTDPATVRAPVATRTGRTTMTKVTLTDARVRALRPRKTVRDIRDSKLTGFGVRVQPSGARRFFVHSQHRGERVWKIVGDAVTTNVGEARSCAEAMLVAIKRGEDAPRRPKETLFETVAETVFQSYARVWKAWTMTVNRGYLEETASAPLRGASGRRHRQAGLQELVRLPARHAGGGRPVPAGALRHHAGSGMDGPPAGRIQPLPGHPPLLPEGARARINGAYSGFGIIAISMPATRS